MLNNNHSLLLVQTKFATRNELIVTVTDTRTNEVAMIRWKFRNSSNLETDAIDEVVTLSDDAVKGGNDND